MGVSKSYDRVNNRLRMGPKLNQASYTLLAHQALKANAASDQDACTFLVNITKFSGRTLANTEHADTWAILLPHLDESLKESFLHCRSARKPMDIWWSAKKSFAGLITPVADVDKCMAVLREFSGVEQELYRVVQSKTGAAMFGPALKEFQRGKVATALHEHLDALAREKVIDNTVLQDHRDRYLNYLVGIGLDPRVKFPKVLSNKVFYCGTLVFLDTTTLYDHYLMGESALLEGIGVDTAEVRALYCETQLVTQNRPLPVAKVDSEILKQYDLSREAVIRAITSQKPSGDLILQTLSSQLKSACEDHPGFRVTVAFWQSVVGAGSELRLQRELLACLPDGTVQVTPSQALLKMDTLARSTFYGFLGIGPRANFATARKFVDIVNAGRRPNYDTIMQACAGWCVFEVASGSAAPNLFTVEDAAKHHFDKADELQKTQNYKASAPHLNQCVLFGWLLTADQRDAVAKMSDAGANADLEATAKNKMASVASCKAKPGRKAIKPSARDAVLNMLA